MLTQKSRITQIFKIFQSLNPTPNTELHFQSPFQLLVAVMLSAQTTDKNVNKATPTLFQQAPTAQSMAQLTPQHIGPHIRSLNYWPTKANNLIAMAQRLVQNHGGKVPLTQKQLLALPGVGVKTASVVLNALAKKPVIAVDTHVFRVATRLGLAKALTPPAMQAPLTRAVPSPFRLHAHHWLILHGRYVCQAKKPLCPTCPVRHLCPSAPKN